MNTPMHPHYMCPSVYILIPFTPSYKLPIFSTFSLLQYLLSSFHSTYNPQYEHTYLLHVSICPRLDPVHTSHHPSLTPRFLYLMSLPLKHLTQEGSSQLSPPPFIALYFFDDVVCGGHDWLHGSLEYFLCMCVCRCLYV